MDISSLDIVLPCYNPSEEWETTIISTYNSIQDLLPNTTISVVLVNDGSTKSVTKEKIELLRSSVPQTSIISYEQNKGKGYALRKGVEASTSELIIITDVDFPYQNQSFVDVFHSLCEGNDVVLGYRNESYYKKTPPFRKRLSKTFRNILTQLFNLKTTDTQCGIKGFNQKGKALFLQTTINRFLFDLEFVILISKQKNIQVNSINVALKEGVIFSKMRLYILITETLNLTLLLIKRTLRA